MLQEVLWNVEITKFPRKFDFFYTVHNKHNYAINNKQVNKFHK